MTHLRCVSVAATILLAALNCFAGDVKVIANSSVASDAISARDLKSIFLCETNRLKGSHVEAVLQKSGPAHELFLKTYLRQNDAELQAYYRSLVVTGRGSMPKELASDSEVVAYVAKTRGAIGYVSIDVQLEGVKLLAISQGVNDVPRKLLTRIEADYPDTLQRLQIGGTVRLAVTISPKGSVENVEILGGNPILAEAALRAVRKWVYSPAPFSTVIEVSVPFVPAR